MNSDQPVSPPPPERRAIRVLICPPAEDPREGRRPGPCHIYGRCPDLNTCTPRQRCCFKVEDRYKEAPDANF